MLRGMRERSVMTEKLEYKTFYSRICYSSLFQTLSEIFYDCCADSVMPLRGVGRHL